MPKAAFDPPAGRLDQPLGTPVPLKQYDPAPPVQPLLTDDSRTVYAVKPPAQAWPFQKLTREQWDALDVTQRIALEDSFVELVRTMLVGKLDQQETAK